MIRNAILKAARTGLLLAAVISASPLVVPATASPQVKTSAKFAEPMNEAVDLVKSRKFSAALPKVEQAAPLAKSRGERLAIEQLRTAIYSGLGRTADLIKSLESQLDIGGLPTATVKAHKLTLAGLYNKQNNDAKAVEITREYIDAYGGKPDQYAFVAGYELKKKKYSEALRYAEKAIDAARSSKSPVPEAWRQIIMRAEFERGNLDGYYSAVEQAAAAHPKAEYFRVLPERAAREPRFNRTLHQLLIYRAMDAGNVSLTPQEQADMGERAFTRGLPEEAAEALKALAASNYKGIDASKIDRLKRMRTQIVAEAKADLDRRASAAKSSAKGAPFVVLGEAYSVAGNQLRAIDSIQQALTFQDLDAGEADFARLQLGIAQFRAGKADTARQTWSGIKSDNGAASLARLWRLISRSKLA